MRTQAEAPEVEPLSSEQTGIALKGVRRCFRARKRELVALDGVDLAVSPGEVVAVVGPSGCGKSTLLELVAGLQEPDGGTVGVGSAKVAAARRAACSYMPQRDLLLPWRDALGNAALALECQGSSRAEARRRAAPLFERFGLAQFERARPAALSGGMRQRVAFLRTLLPGRPVLLLDEPFGALDSITRGSMQEWLQDALAHEPRTVLLVTHDVQEALFLADRVAILSPRPGRVVAELEVDLPRPRVRRELVTDPAFGRLEQAALDALEAGEPRDRSAPSGASPPEGRRSTATGPLDDAPSPEAAP
jgi:ABC-type nitrate/sulfonate/bicarbonate transport system ATPase subunit